MMSSRHTCGIVPGARGIHKGSVCHTLGLTPVTVLLNRPLSSVSGLYTSWFRNKLWLGTFIEDACTSYQATCSEVGRPLNKTCAYSKAGPVFFIVEPLVLSQCVLHKTAAANMSPSRSPEPPSSAGFFNLQLGQVSLRSPPQVGCKDICLVVEPPDVQSKNQFHG